MPFLTEQEKTMQKVANPPTEVANSPAGVTNPPTEVANSPAEVANPPAKDSLEVQVHARIKGEGTVQGLRRNKLVPAIVYGPTQKPLSLSLEIRSAEKYSQKEYENKIFTFKSKSKELNNLKVIKKDISYHKVTRRPLHMDFLSLDMSKKVRVHVEVYFTGKAKGVKESGGVFNIIRRNVEVECLPAEIPESFSIDVSPLNINQNFHVSDLKIPENIKLITSAKRSLCAVSEIAEEEESKAVETSATAEVPADSKEAKPSAPDKKDSKKDSKQDGKKDSKKA